MCMFIPTTARYRAEIKASHSFIVSGYMHSDHVLASLTTQVISRLMSETSSGSFCSNDSVLQSLMVALPFGGVGELVTSDQKLCQMSL